MKKQSVAFNARLRALRTEAGVSVATLAQRAALSSSYVCDLESGRRKPSLAMAQKIAHALGVSLAVFEEKKEKDG